MFCKWDVPIVPCVSFQNALFCGPRGLTFTWWGRCGLRFCCDLFCRYGEADLFTFALLQ